MKLSVEMVMSVAVAVVFWVSQSHALGVIQSIRATEVTPKMFAELEKGTSGDVVVEFRQGDRLPVSIKTEGDLLETVDSTATLVSVKRSFWLKLEQNQLTMSLDGQMFKPISQSLTGSLTVRGSGENIETPINAIHVLFKAYIKP